MLPNIVLIGFMGSGKTSVGRHLAALTGHRFVDTDELIVQRAGMEIAQIFETHGEAAFRDWETAVLRELEGVCGVVLATGGGIVLREENRALLRKIGVPVWLDAREDVLFERASRGNKRPLLQCEDPREAFDRLRAERKGLYEMTACARVDSTLIGHADAARQVLDAALRVARAHRAAATAEETHHS